MISPDRNGAIRRVLVTGATGFLGRHLTDRLRRETDLEVVAVSQKDSSATDEQVMAVDLGDREAMWDWAQRYIISDQCFEAVFHLAARVPTRFDSADAQFGLDANLRMTENVLALAEECGSAVVFASSTSVYGSRPPVPATEESLPAPDNSYAEGKLACEALVTDFAKRTGLQGTSLRIAAPYGPGQSIPTVVTSFIGAALAGRDLLVHGSGNRTQDFTFVTDVAEAFWLAFMRGGSGVFNVSGGTPVTMLRLAELVISCIGSSESRVVVGTEPDAQDGYRGVFPIEKARQQFGFEPRVGLLDGLARTAAAHTALR